MKELISSRKHLNFYSPVCARLDDDERRIEELRTYLVKKCYNGEAIQHQIDKASELSKEDLLRKERKKDKEQVTPLVVRFHPKLPNLMRILHDYQCVINTSP